ncbi:MAG: GGDEF domain-containing protein, partial [Roseateles sp.]
RRGDRSPFAVLFIDFDHFKAINERFGHAVGDAVLQELGQRLQAGVAPGDLVARYASDEFVLLMASVGNRADAEAARSQLEASLQEPLASLAAFAAQADPMGASIGLALYPDDASSTEALLKLADADMYARKQGLAMTRTQALDLRTAPDDRQP